MRAHPLPEARSYADMMLTELRKVIPSFLQRVDVAERGGEWTSYLASTRDATARVVERLWPEAGDAGPVRRHGRDRRAGGDACSTSIPTGRKKCWRRRASAICDCSEREAARRVRLLGHDERVALLAAYVGDRRNRRHRPGRAFERTDYRFELVTDYGAVPRSAAAPHAHDRMAASRHLARVRHARARRRCRTAAISTSRPSTGPKTCTARWLPDFAEQAVYAVALAHRIRYVMQCNAREAMHLIELRSGSQGHPAYRRVAQQMHRAIAERRRPPRPGRRHDLRRPRVDRPRAARIGAAVRAAACRKICNTVTRNYRQSPR